jgi:LDH2 family malate/lactate/ureidoglycolate dehydrogenase
MNKPVNILYAKFEHDSHDSSCHLLSAESRMYGFYVQIDGFIDKDEFKKQIDEWIRVFRNTRPAPSTNGPLIPGVPERKAEAIRSKEVIPLINEWWMTCWIFRNELE